MLATVHVLRTLVDSYAGQAFDIHWRVWLNERLTHDWLDGRAYYRGHFLDQPSTTPTSASSRTSGCSSPAPHAGHRRPERGGVAGGVHRHPVGLVGALAVAGVEIPRAMVFMVYVYVVIATVFAFRIGRPLIRLSFLSERLTANFRYALVRLRENAENVAFYQGEGVERATLRERFLAYVANLWARVYRGLKFDGFNLAVSQVAVVFPSCCRRRASFPARSSWAT